MKHNKKTFLGTLSFVDLHTENFEKLIDFYTNTLGLEPVSDKQGNWFGFKTGQTTFALEPEANRRLYDLDYNKNNPVLLQFRVDDEEQLAEMTRDLESKGVLMLQKMLKRSYGTVTTFLDPDGNVIELLLEP